MALKNVLLSAGLMLGVVACKETKTEAPAPKSVAPAAPAAAPAAAPTTPAAAEAKLAVPADFEEAVEAKITADNYAAELDKLEAELAE